MPRGFTHERAGPAEWYTPPGLFDALGLTFDLDPAAPPGGVSWVPAERSYSRADDGLVQPWRGRVWLNPPYGRETGRWLERLVIHGDGLALVFARTDTRWWQRLTPQATAVCFVAGRLRFIGPDRRTAGTAGAPSALLAFGLPCAIAVFDAGLGQTVVVPQPCGSEQAPRPIRQSGAESLDTFRNLNETGRRSSVF